MDIAKFFDKNSKKRDHSSSSSSTNDDQKKLKESSKDSFNEDVFVEEAQSSSEGQKSLFQCLRNLENKVQQIINQGNLTQQNQIKGENQLAEVKESLSFLSTKFDEYERERKEKDIVIKDLKKEVSSLNSEVQDLSKSLDRQAQYSRRNCLLLHGVKEDSKEDTDEVAINIINKELELELNVKDLDRSHRIGRNNFGKKYARPIIVKFARYNNRREVYAN